MFCTQCGFELEDTDLFCARCGKPTKPGVNPATQPERRLTRSMRDKKIAGVCSGFARYMGVDATLMRIIWLTLLLVTGGIMGIVYVFAWIVMPRDEPTAGQVSAAVEQRT